MNALWHSLGVQGIKYTIFYRHITSPLPSNGWGPRGEEYAEKRFFKRTELVSSKWDYD